MSLNAQSYLDIAKAEILRLSCYLGLEDKIEYFKGIEADAKAHLVTLTTGSRPAGKP